MAEEEFQVKTKCNDGEVVVLAESVAVMNGTLKSLLEDLGRQDTPIPLANVSSSVMKKIVEFCEHHKGDEVPVRENASESTVNASAPLSKWDREFCTVQRDVLFEMILAANYLDNKPLLDATCKMVAELARDKTPEELRNFFDLPDDFTDEQRVQIAEEKKFVEGK